MVPRLGGTKRWWIQQLVGEQGLVDPQLWSVIDNLPADPDIPEDKELIVFTKMTFDLNDYDQALGRLDATEPEFMLVESNDAERIYHWSREYPRNHWSPLRLLGGRQSLGTVRLRRSQLIGEAKTLSMAARLVVLLKDLLGERISFASGRWKDPTSFLREDEADARS